MFWKTNMGMVCTQQKMSRLSVTTDIYAIAYNFEQTDTSMDGSFKINIL